MRLLSISSGKVTPLFGDHHPNYKIVASAIRKQSISTLNNPESVEITRLGVQGDEQADLSVHGGLEKAIYVYPAEHYAFWNELLTRETKKSVQLQYGAIGENFTIEGLLETDVYVGDKAMLQSGFSGWYLRVHQAGSLTAGVEIKHVSGPKDISIDAQNRALLNRSNQHNLWE